MKNHEMYCSACDREVRVFITKAPAEEGHATLSDPELVCLEIGAQCTGSLCPLGAAEPNAMVRRLIRNGIPLDTLSTITARCPTCDAEAQMVLYGQGRAACSICGTAARWVVDHAEA